jgi:hypothetical protein
MHEQERNQRKMNEGKNQQTFVTRSANSRDRNIRVGIVSTQNTVAAVRNAKSSARAGGRVRTAKQGKTLGIRKQRTRGKQESKRDQGPGSVNSVALQKPGRGKTRPPPE